MRVRDVIHPLVYLPVTPDDDGDDALEASETSMGSSADGETCDNGLPGVSNGLFCCTLGCGECGGDNCTDRGEGLNRDGA